MSKDLKRLLEAIAHAVATGAGHDVNRLIHEIGYLDRDGASYFTAILSRLGDEGLRRGDGLCLICDSIVDDLVDIEQDVKGAVRG